MAGAPKFGDAASWGPRLPQGLDGLTKVALAGSLTSSAGDYAEATHPVWWMLAAAGASIAVLGVLSTGAYAKQTAAALGPLLDPP